MRRHAPTALLAIAAAAVTFAAPRAQAAPEFVYRSLTLPRGDVALDLGLGYGHAPANPNGSVDGFGLNLEIAGGVTHDLELGFRTGVRFDDGGRATRADLYGRPFETEDRYGTGGDTVANPELRMTWTVARGAIPQIGLEARAYLPFENGTHFGVMFGVPIALRLGTVRFDTGVYVPIIFDNPTVSAVSIPLHIWIQASPTFWLGPLLGLRIESGHDAYPLGFGFGSAVSRQVDLRAWFLFPDLNQDDHPARTFGVGVGLRVRFE